MFTPKQIEKIRSDKYFSELLDQQGPQAVLDAGYFDDGDDQIRDISKTVNPLCTPINFLKPLKSNSCVIISTGSFCPIHNGHIEAMELGKILLEVNSRSAISRR